MNLDKCLIIQSCSLSDFHPRRRSIWRYIVTSDNLKFISACQSVVLIMISIYVNFIIFLTFCFIHILFDIFFILCNTSLRNLLQQFLVMPYVVMPYIFGDAIFGHTVVCAVVTTVSMKCINWVG